MDRKPIEVCLSDTYLCARIKYLGYKISKRRPNTYSVEDGEQELWEAVITGLPRLPVNKAIIEYAGDLAYSKYGHIISSHGNLGEYRYEYADRMEDWNCLKSTGRQEEILDVKIVLDSIESALQAEAWKSRQFKLALSSIKFLRQGYTQTETAENIGVSTQTLKHVMATVRRRVKEVA